MKSVGEIMAIGRTFEETVQKALRMVDESCNGFEGSRFDIDSNNKSFATLEEVTNELKNPSPIRIWAIAAGFERGLSIEYVHDLTKIDRWFLSKLYNIHSIHNMLKARSVSELSEHATLLSCAKKSGFSDKQIAA